MDFKGPRSFVLITVSLGVAGMLLVKCVTKEAPAEKPGTALLRPPVKKGPPLRWLSADELAKIAEEDEYAALVPFELPLGLKSEAGAAFVNRDKPITKERVELGRLLYFDTRLSFDNTISCATCHHPNLGWSDEGPTSIGIRGQKGGRNAPMVLNTLFVAPQFWDGREPDLEGQAKGPITNPIEMGMPDHDTAVKKIAAIKGYGSYFKAAFGDERVDIGRIADAIAAFERTVVSGNSPFDRWKAGDASAMSESAIRGEELFRTKAKCTQCHVGAVFSDNAFHNLGVGCSGDACTDWGRWEISKQSENEKGAFKTPSLRNIAQSPPYMHDGSEKTLREVVQLYNRGGNPNKWKSPLIFPLNLTDPEVDDVVAFLEALTGEVTPVEEPKVFPK